MIKTIRSGAIGLWLINLAILLLICAYFPTKEITQFDDKSELEIAAEDGYTLSFPNGTTQFVGVDKFNRNMVEAEYPDGTFYSWVEIGDPRITRDSNGKYRLNRSEAVLVHYLNGSTQYKARCDKDYLQGEDGLYYTPVAFEALSKSRGLKQKPVQDSIVLFNLWFYLSEIALIAITLIVISLTVLSRIIK